MKFVLPPSRRIVLLLLTFVFGMLITGVITGLLMQIAGESRQLAMMRISAVVQDLLMLVVPAVLTAVLVTRQPAGLLAIDRAPRLLPTLLAILVMLAASPAMSKIIEWNAGMHLPHSLAALEQSMRAMEDHAAGAVDAMLGPHTIGNLVISLLIVGILAGFSEELFFRGALQRILSSGSLNGTAAVWVSAIIFSAVHFQFFGFVPRLLLGVYFGYLLLWSRSVWLPMLAHIVNNSLYVVLRYTTGSGEPDLGDAGSSWMLVVASIVITAGGLIWLRNILKTEKTDD
ncbi:MAG: CPBP family intramembrane metalloprotease [Bacteroidales bacterium]|nr:CPBP family intramembrane metalloprotease [Bacteroidales bacterium]